MEQGTLSKKTRGRSENPFFCSMLGLYPVSRKWRCEAGFPTKTSFKKWLIFSQHTL
jgi:hypothetical protein